MAITNPPAAKDRPTPGNPAKHGKPAAVAGRETKEQKRGLPPSKKTLAEEAEAKTARDKAAHK